MPDEESEGECLIERGEESSGSQVLLCHYAKSARYFVPEVDGEYRRVIKPYYKDALALVNHGH